jgi:hypothetical protein
MLELYYLQRCCLIGAFWVGFGAAQTPSFDSKGFFQSGQDGTDISEFYASYGEPKSPL